MTREEFSRYVERDYERLYRFLKARLGNAQDAQDLLQKTLMKLLPRLDDIDAAGPDGYFFQALRNALIDHWRRRGRRPPEGELPDQLPGGSEEGISPPADGSAEETCREVLREAASHLTPRERKAIAACWQAHGDRAGALAGLGLGEDVIESDDKEDKQEKYRTYDGPLFHAKRKLAQALSGHIELLTEVGPDRVWDLVHEVFCGDSADAAL
jgi:RNA polymerase sigma factor (sigma-70 family)